MGLSLVSSQVLRLCCFFFVFYILLLSQHHQASCRQINRFYEHFRVADQDHEDQGRTSYEEQLPQVLLSQLGRGRQSVQRRPPPTAGRLLDRPRRSPPPPMPQDPNRD